MHHQLDFVIQIIDAMTDAPITEGVNQFWLNGQPIRPIKALESGFVFSDVLSNPQKVHVAAPPDFFTLTWHNPHFQELKTTVTMHTTVPLIHGQTYTRRALPSAFYPFKQPPTGVKGKLEGLQRISVAHYWNANRYHLTGPVTPGGILAIAQSQNRRLAGKTLQIKEHDQIATIRIDQDAEAAFRYPKDIPVFTEDAEVIEMIEVPADAYGLFFVALPNVQKDFVSEPAIFIFIGEAQQAVMTVELHKNQLILLDNLAWEHLKKE